MNYNTFLERVKKVIDSFKENNSIKNFNSKESLQYLCNRYISLYHMVEKYYDTINTNNINYEVLFQKDLGYFNKSNNSGNIDYSLIDEETNSINFSSDSLNLLTSKIMQSFYYEIIHKQVQNIKSVDSSMCELVGTYVLNKGISRQKQEFTFAGERFILNGYNEENGTVNAIPYREIENMGDIGCLRFLEYILVQIKEKSCNNEKTIKIATFGKLNNAKNEKEVLETVIEKILGEHWNIDITTFSLQKLTPFMILLESDDKKIKGNLLEKDFYIKQCKEFDIMFLLDNGYIYTDSHNFVTYANHDTPFEYVKDNYRVLMCYQIKDEMDQISLGVFRHFYESVLKWIEKVINQKNNSLEFDEKLYYILNSLKQELNDRSLYLFMSGDSGISLSSNKVYNSLLLSERSLCDEVKIHDWSNHKKNTIKEYERRNNDITQEKPSDNGIITVRLWDLLKRMGNYFYSKGFVNLFKDEQVTDDMLKDASFDVDFILYAYNTSIYFDLNNILTGLYTTGGKCNGKISFGISNSNGSQSLYNNITKILIKNMLLLSYDPQFNLFGSGAIRSVLTNVMNKNAISVEQVLKIGNLDIKFFSTEKIDVEILNEDTVEKLDMIPKEYESYALYRQRQIDNMILHKLIKRIKLTSFHPNNHHKLVPEYTELMGRDENDTKNINEGICRILKIGKVK